MPENDKECGWRLLQERVERLHSLLQIKTPTFIVVSEVRGIMDAAFLYCPEAMGRDLANEKLRSLRVEKGFCIVCGDLLPEDQRGIYGGKNRGRCDNCNAELAATIKQMDAEDNLDDSDFDPATQ